MPIRPENKALYPADWRAISDAVKHDAGWRCEWEGCGAEQYAWGLWIQLTGDAPRWKFIPWGKAQSYKLARQAMAEEFFSRGDDGTKPVVIVLTVAHLDHNPTNCDRPNLRCWCQRHHLAYDQAHHGRTAYSTRRSGLVVAELF